jgi:hypothetical protein
MENKEDDVDVICAAKDAQNPIAAQNAILIFAQPALF